MRAAAPTDHRPDPTNHTLFRVVQQHLETFLTRVEANGGALPSFVVRETRAIPGCSLLCRSFATIHCGSRGADQVVCVRLPSPPHLPAVPIRQWVFRRPFDLRHLLACDAEPCRAVRATFIRTALCQVERRTSGAGAPGGRHVRGVIPAVHRTGARAVSAIGTAVGNRATIGIPIPSSTAHVGLAFFNQAFVLDPGANALGVVSSNAGAGRVGSR